MVAFQRWNAVYVNGDQEAVTPHGSRLSDNHVFDRRKCPIRVLAGARTSPGDGLRCHIPWAHQPPCRAVHCEHSLELEHTAKSQPRRGPTWGRTAVASSAAHLHAAFRNMIARVGLRRSEKTKLRARKRRGSAHVERHVYAAIIVEHDSLACSGHWPAVWRRRWPVQSRSVPTSASKSRLYMCMYLYGADCATPRQASTVCYT
jgi:hypothetical protein